MDMAKRVSSTLLAVSDPVSLDDPSASNQTRYLIYEYF